jgi:ABC-2 type transport system permease protein
MKTINIFKKSLKEQLRSYWVLLLSLSMGPFFIFVYYLIIETSKPQYEILVINQDKGIAADGQQINHGKCMIDFFKKFKCDTISMPLTIIESFSKEEAINELKAKKADALLIIDGSFSKGLNQRALIDTSVTPKVEYIGDLTNSSYLISVVWMNELLTEYTLLATNSKRVVEVKEMPLGISASINDFDMMVPGILIVSLIMLMFTASIAFVSEVENKTLMRLKLSKIKSIEFLGGISLMQLIIGLGSVLLTLLMALMLGFNYTGSIWILIIVAGLTSISIIAFSLIIAALTKTANEVLVVANFPMFLFMFFTGAAFPFKANALFSIAGYPVSLQGLMSPTHAISALNKALVMDMDFKSIIPEILSILILTLMYFMIGAILFKRKHLRLS